MSVVEPDNVSIIGNVGDDIEVLDLHVSPDLDSILYALAGVADEERGWGRADESWNALATVGELGGDAWFRLGDRDIGLHLVRTQLLREGAPLSDVTARLARAFGLDCVLLPATDDPLRTFVETPAGTFPFQTWFVARGHRDEVDALHYTGAPSARAAPGVIDAIEGADVIAIAPSNPYVSIAPILAVADIRAALERRRVPCIAVSPIIGGRAVKGPADRMLARLASGTTPAAVASCYPGLIDGLVIDEADAPAKLPDGVRPVVTRTLMTDEDARRRLAHAVVDAAGAVA
jgi:LPPG:FO 2-phospho-L-lactate transferase